LCAWQLVLAWHTHLGLFLDDSLLVAWQGFVVSLRPVVVGWLDTRHPGIDREHPALGATISPEGAWTAAAG